MFKPYRFIIALVMIGLVGSTFGQQVDAAATAGDTNKAPEVEQPSTEQYQDQTWEIFIQKFFGKWYAESYNQHEVKQPNESTNQNKVENKQEIEQPKKEEQTEQVEQKPNDQVDSALHPFEQQVFELTNAERVKNGLAPLKLDTELSIVSRDKSQDMLDNQYFAHDSPTYGSPFDMMSDYGIDYRAAGENIAKGQRSPEEVVNAWMNSQGHRENILSNKFTHIGVGYVEQENVWTQQFIGK